jgi:RNA polymerase sigma-70 factor (ECF subfamily)
VNEHDWLAERFEEHRPHLRSVAYRMLGSVNETDDAVQEAWFRLARTDAAAVENLGAWLTTVVARVCLDMLRARRARREESMGSWLPEPVVSVDGNPTPEEEALIADSVGLALLIVLDALTPGQRLAYVLHDMFGVPFADIADILGRSPAAVRQLASQGRRRVRGAAPPPDATLDEQRRVVDAFLAASRAADFEALIGVLDPDVVFRFDAGPESPLARPPVHGADAVARQVVERGTRFAPLGRPALVNGGPGVVVGHPGSPFAVVGFTVAAGRITAIDLVMDPDKLSRLSVRADGA